MKKTTVQTNEYWVDQWPTGDCFEDLGIVLNSMISDIKSRQSEKNLDNRGKPGAVIYIPPGDYKLKTPVLIDISFLRIEGKGHGFISSSIRHNMGARELEQANEYWPGGSRVLVEIPSEMGMGDGIQSAFIVSREGTPRISSIEFSNFCIDGLHFEDNGSGLNPENSYKNGKGGIFVKDPNDSLVISEMGFVYLETAIRVDFADALSIHSNFIAENGTCIELLGWGQASKITNNLLGAGPNGHGIYAENHGGLLVTSNNIFPRGASSITLSNVVRSNISSNRLHSFYPGMVRLIGDCSENLISSNHFVRDNEPWLPFSGVSNGLDDSEGLMVLEGDANTITSNHFSMVEDTSTGHEPLARQTAIRVRKGSRNYISCNNIVSPRIVPQRSENCVESQVESLTARGAGYASNFSAVIVEVSSYNNTILDTGDETQVICDLDRNVVRPLPKSPLSS